MELDDSSSVPAKESFTGSGHGSLKWGSLISIAGFAFVFIANILSTGSFAALLGIVGILMVFGGLICWIVGMVKRIRFNKKSRGALPFTAGEKIALVGIAILILGILLVNGIQDEDGIVMARLIGIVGLIGAAGGVVWHLLTPRNRK